MIDFWHIFRIICYILWGVIVLLFGTLVCYLMVTIRGGNPYVFSIGLVLAGTGVYRMIRAWRDSERAKNWKELSQAERGLILTPMVNLCWVIPPLYFIWQMNASPQFVETIIAWCKQPTFTSSLTILLGYAVISFGIFRYVIDKKSDSYSDGYEHNYTDKENGDVL